MAKYKITGVDKESGLDTDLVLEAPTERDAAIMAGGQGCAVVRVKKISATGSRKPLILTLLCPPAVALLMFVVWFFALRPVDEATRNARIRATVSGAAWSVKGAGSSDLLRGMQVFLLKPECSGTTVRQCYQHAADRAKEDAASCRKEAKKYRETPDPYGTWKEGADKYDAEAKGMDEYATATISGANGIPDRMDVREAYRLMRDVADSEPRSKKYAIVMPLGGMFGGVLKECAEKTVQVNVDGKFSFEAVPGGNHYLYACWSTELSSIEWLIPLNVKESGTISQDLFNDTAVVIWNKSR